MIERILPATVVAMDTTIDPPEAALLPEEQSLVARAVEKRRQEVTTTRHCARQAMLALGLSPVAIPRGERGQPLWPDGVVGSLTHTSGYRGAALSTDSGVFSVGIDAEPHGPLPDGVLEAVSLKTERDWIEALSASAPEVHWDRLLFCAKECVYKTWFPLAERWLGFEEAEISVRPESCAFSAQLRVPGPVVRGRELRGFTGRWMVSDGLVLAAIVCTGPGG